MKRDINTLIEDINKLLNTEGAIFADVYQHTDLPVICIHIKCGDWKHAHLRCDFLMQEHFGLEVLAKETTDQDGSDCYSAIHYYLAA